MQLRCSRTLLLIFVAILVSTSAFALTPVKHVVVVVLENHSYSEVVGNSSMPFFNSLVRRGTLETRYYANAHPSLPNYFVLTTGRKIASSDGYSGTVTSNNVVRQLLLAGETWKAYADALPYTGYLGGDRYPYVKHHNPFAYIAEVKNSSSERLNIVPFTRFASDLRNNNLPNYSFVIPSNVHNGHNNSLGTTDRWLQANIGPLLNNAAFRSSGVLIVLFDESRGSDTAYGGGRIAVVKVGTGIPIAKATTFHQHQSALRLTCALLRFRTCPAQ